MHAVEDPEDVQHICYTWSDKQQGTRRFADVIVKGTLSLRALEETRSVYFLH